MASQVASLRPEDPRLRRALYVSIGLLLALGVGLAVVATLDRFPDLEWRFEPGWLALGITAFTLHVLASAEIWRRLLGALGPHLGVRPALAIWCPSALGRYVPTSLLLPLLRAAMAEREGVPKRICLTSVVYEFALALTGAVILGAYFVVDLPALRDEPSRFLVLAVPILAFVALHPTIFHRVANAALTRLGREKLPVALPLRRAFEFAGLYGLALVVAGVGVYGLAQTVYPVPGDDWMIVIGAYASAVALSLIAFMLPGGLIAREAALALALSPVMPAAPAIAVAVLARMVQIATEVLLAGLTPVLRSRA